MHNDKANKSQPKNFQFRNFLESHFGKILFAIIFFSLGNCVAVFLPKWALFEISYEISLVEVLTLLLTVILAWYVGYVIDRQNTKNRSEKELIFEEIKRLQTKARNNYSVICNCNYQETVASIKSLGMSITWLQNFLNEFFDDINVEEEFQIMQNCLTDIDHLATYLPEDSEESEGREGSEGEALIGTIEIETENNKQITKYDSLRVAAINNATETLVHHLMGLIIKINWH